MNEEHRHSKLQFELTMFNKDLIVQPPNILLLYTDQQRFDTIRANGNTEIHTPNLDQLAEDGINFDHYFVQNPVCMPSRLSFLSGCYPSTLGVTQMGVPVDQEIDIIPHYLRNKGYRSGNIGKLHFLPHACRDHRDIHPNYGFDHLEISDEPGPYPDAYRSWVENAAPEQLDKISLGLPPAAEVWQNQMGVKDNIKHPKERFPLKPLPFRGDPRYTHSSFVAEQTMNFVEQNRHRPFLCISGFYSPHSPWVSPQEFIDLYDPSSLTVSEYPEHVEDQRNPDSFTQQERRGAHHGYYAMISEVDHHVGCILSHLDEIGLRDNTIIVFTSDHGEWLGEHLKYGKGYPGHDCVTRVPLIIRWPKIIKNPGRNVSSLIEGVDVLPTLLESVGIPRPQKLQGRSFFPSLLDREWNERPAVKTEMYGWKTLRNHTHRYILCEDGTEQLYHLSEDPRAYFNCAEDPSQKEMLTDMRLQLLLHELESERPIQRVWPY